MCVGLALSHLNGDALGELDPERLHLVRGLLGQVGGNAKTSRCVEWRKQGKKNSSARNSPVHVSTHACRLSAACSTERGQGRGEMIRACYPNEFLNQR